MTRRLPVGVRTCLYGAHCFFLHPLFVYRAWVLLYGPVTDGRLLAAFFVHDLGYLTRAAPNLDGPEGERHVEWGAAVMARLFGQDWGQFTAYHSRFYAQQCGQPFSRLCPADKLASALAPRWLYLTQVIATGEVWEYLAECTAGKYTAEQRSLPALDISPAEIAARRLTPRTWRAILAWHARTAAFLRTWAWTHRDHGTAQPGGAPCGAP